MAKMAEMSGVAAMAQMSEGFKNYARASATVHPGSVAV
jgi:hypothetical protein